MTDVRSTSQVSTVIQNPYADVPAQQQGAPQPQRQPVVDAFDYQANALASMASPLQTLRAAALATTRRSALRPT